MAFFFKSCHLWDNVEKYNTARQATDYNYYGVKNARIQILIICNTGCLSTVTNVTQTQCYVIRKLPTWFFDAHLEGVPTLSMIQRQRKICVYNSLFSWVIHVDVPARFFAWGRCLKLKYYYDERPCFLI